MVGCNGEQVATGEIESRPLAEPSELIVRPSVGKPEARRTARPLLPGVHSSHAQIETISRIRLRPGFGIKGQSFNHLTRLSAHLRKEGSLGVFLIPTMIEEKERPGRLANSNCGVAPSSKVPKVPYLPSRPRLLRYASPAR